MIKIYRKKEREEIGQNVNNGESKFKKHTLIKQKKSSNVLHI